MAVECAEPFMRPPANNYMQPAHDYRPAALVTLKLHLDSVFKRDIFFMQSDHGRARTFRFWRLATDALSIWPRPCPYVLLHSLVSAPVFTAWTENWRQTQPCAKYAAGCTAARIWTVWIRLFLRFTCARTSGYILIGGPVS